MGLSPGSQPPAQEGGFCDPRDCSTDRRLPKRGASHRGPQLCLSHTRDHRPTAGWFASGTLPGDSPYHLDQAIHTSFRPSPRSWPRDFPGGPAVKTSPSTAGGAGLIPGRGAKIPHASQPKIQNIKQKQNCNKFNKDFKNGPHQKKKIFKKKCTLTLVLRK